MFIYFYSTRRAHRSRFPSGQGPTRTTRPSPLPSAMLPSPPRLRSPEPHHLPTSSVRDCEAKAHPSGILLLLLFLAMRHAHHSLQDVGQLAQRALPPSLRLCCPLFHHAALLPFAYAPPSRTTRPLRRFRIGRRGFALRAFVVCFILLLSMRHTYPLAYPPEQNLTHTAHPSPPSSTTLHLWPCFRCPPASSVPDTCASRSNLPAIPLSPSSVRALSLVHFIANALQRVRLMFSMTLAHYLLRGLETRFIAARRSSGHRLFISAFTIASKVICNKGPRLCLAHYTLPAPSSGPSANPKSSTSSIPAAIPSFGSGASPSPPSTTITPISFI
jgi:hypothetical protein